MAIRKQGTSHTTISISWEDKDEFRKFAQLVKKTRNGDMYESDSILFHKLLEFFKQHHESGNTSKSTYPRKIISHEHDQPDSLNV